MTSSISVYSCYSGVSSILALVIVGLPEQLSIAADIGSIDEPDMSIQESSNLGSGFITLEIEFFKQSDKVLNTE